MFIIPARLASTRFPQKILTDVAGYPMVIRTALKAKEIGNVVVACDDNYVKELCKKYSIEAVLTSSLHTSGTDRINEACEELGLDDNDIVINLQADEPFIEAEILTDLASFTQVLKRDFVMTSCYKSVDVDEASDSNLVKVVTDENGDALYFSRSKIPFDRDGGFSRYRGHLGLYGFKRHSLRTFCALSPHILETTEKLEQLRALGHGFNIAMIEVQTKSFGIDTPHDLERALKSFYGA